MNFNSEKFNSDTSEILERAAKCEKISEKDGIALMNLTNSNDILNLGIAADRIRKQKVGDIVSFVLNLHINYTNTCISKCEFCAYYKDKEDKGGYVLSVNEILEMIKKAKQISNITEVHIVGALNPEISAEYYEDILKEIRKNFPDLAIKAFTATEIFFIAKKNKSSVKEILERFKDAGLNVMPGGGAEILNDEIRAKICPNKIKSDEWLNVMETAHKLNIKSNATMLYGHIESSGDRIRHILKLRDLQKKTNGFLGFIPLSFHPKGTKLDKERIVKMPVSGIEDLKVIAVSRILLNNFDSVRAYWVMMGKNLAQVALHYGANDFDGTVGKENITYSAGKISERSAGIDELKNLIKGAGRIPAIRTTDYKIIEILE